ncbi:hypothetical protein JKF63_06842 [Porcisia hertigi]|uniref:Uncharacterized protein n=1 Tax=Porcisia hertigi TaxID=2761500 RepID=A0A836LJ82_9TRYP|nr:hypothetical protein JKF63_06842 [Porcisia hertigi]
MATDVKESHTHHSAGSDLNMANSSSGVAPQRGMRRPVSSYSMVSDHLNTSGSGLGQGHQQTVSPAGGTAAAESRRGLAARGQPGSTSGTVIQAHASTGSARRQLSGATAVACSTANGSSTTRKSSTNYTGALAAPAAAAGGGSAPSGGRNGGPQPPQQQASTTGAATCVGIAPNVLMHLLRGALCGSTTINMVNCTFLVFPLFIGTAAANTVTEYDGTAGHSGGSFAALDRQRPPPQRSGAALLVVAMREPDTDGGAITNFTQCFVNILCREEHRCQYVSAELERMEVLTNHWEVGGAAALVNAAAATAGKRYPCREGNAHQQQQQQATGGGDSESSRAGGGDGSPAPFSCDYDYLFTPSQPAVRNRHANAADNGNPTLANRDDHSPASGAATNLCYGYRQHQPHTSGEGSPLTTAQGSTVTHFLEWIDQDGNAQCDDDDSGSRDDSREAVHSLSQAAALTSGKNMEDSSGPRGGQSPSTAAPAPLMTSASSSSLYQLLAVHVRLAYEVLRVAQCIDVWNRTMRSGCRDSYGTGGGGTEGCLRAGRTSCLASRARGATGALREPRRCLSIAAAYSQQEQQRLAFISAGTALDSLPEALLINHLLLLPMSHLTSTEQQEGEPRLSSAYSRIHPCSVLTVEVDQFTEKLQRRYLDVMGRRYAKLIPLSTVYALLQTLPSPRRAGSFYRSLELTLLEAVQRRHARSAAVATAATNTTSIPNVTNMSDLGATTSETQADVCGSRETMDEDANVIHTSATGTATAHAATTVAGLDLLAMEIIDFLCINGAISVASEMYVCFTHGEVTPAACLEAAAARRRRHRLKAERRRREAEMAASVAAVRGGDHNDAGKREKRCHHRRCADREVQVDTDSGNKSEAALHAPPMLYNTPPTAMGEAASASQSWMSSQTTTIEPTPTGAADAAPLKATPGVFTNSLDAILDMTTVPSALVLHMLECVVDTQQHHSPTTMMDGTAHQGGETATSSTTGLPKTPSTGNMATVGAMLDHTPPSSSTDTSTAGNPASRLASRIKEHDTSLHQKQRGNPLPSTGVARTTATDTLSTIITLTPPRQGSTTHGGSSWLTKETVVDGVVGAKTPQSASALAAPAPLSVYCAWGSACPLCELLAAHPQCWTTRNHRLYTLGYDTIHANRSRHRGSVTAIQLAFPSLDECVYKCARHARHLRDNSDFTALLQNGYTGSDGGPLRSLRPWFMRPDMFITPVTAAYGVSPYEVFERMSNHCNRPSGDSEHIQHLPHIHPSCSPTVGGSCATAASPLAVNNTSTLIEPERCDPLLISRAQAHPQETAMGTTSTAAAVSNAKEQGNTLLQCADIPAAAAEYLRRSSVAIQERLDYARRLRQVLEQYEHVWEQHSTVTAGKTPFTLTATPAAINDATMTIQSTRSTAMVVAQPVSSSTMHATPGNTVEGVTFSSYSGNAGGGSRTSPAPLSASVPTRVTQLKSNTNPSPRSQRYGRRQLPLHVASSPFSNRALLFDNTTPPTDDSALNAPTSQLQQQESQRQNNSTHIDPCVQSIIDTPLAGVTGLLGTENSLPVEVLLQYVLHHLVALTWGKRGIEVDTLVHLLERSLRRLPPLLANLPYIMQLRSAGYTSDSAAAAAAAAATAASNALSNTAGGEGTAAVSSVFTTLNTRLAASSVALSVPMIDAALRESPDHTSSSGTETSPHSGASHAAITFPVTEAEVQLLQAYELLDRLSLMKLLSTYATWPVRTVPTRLLLHTVVNEFSDILYVGNSAAGRFEAQPTP